MKDVTLILVKHGETKEGKRGIILGHRGGTLSLKGKKEIQAISRKIKKIVQDSKKVAIISSDLSRASTSAQIIKKSLSASISYDTLLRERGAGIAEGKKDREIDWKTYEKKPLHLRKHKGGESFSEVHKRAVKFLKRIQKNNNEFIVVVSHTVTLAMIKSYLKKISIETALKKTKDFDMVKIKK